jgi:hypothetical protein
MKARDVMSSATDCRPRKRRELPNVKSAIIKVRRQPGHWRLADYRLSDVSRIRWDYVGGGIQRRSQWHVYGYVMCDAMLSGKIAHSCRHGPPPHRVKVCITKKYNEDVWPLIVEKVGPKPEPRRRKGRRRKAGLTRFELSSVPVASFSATR